MAMSRLWFFHGLFFIFILISIRQYVYPTDSAWTTEAYNFSWGMMLKTNHCRQLVSPDRKHWFLPPLDYLTEIQTLKLAEPFNFHSFIKQSLCKSWGKVYAQLLCRTAARNYSPLIDPTVDICNQTYSLFNHNHWINIYPGAVNPNWSELLDQEFYRKTRW